jgi:[acyl-carrier-protein] S-malonyltransferase
LGLSLGEVTACTAAGVFRFRDRACGSSPSAAGSCSWPASRPSGGMAAIIGEERAKVQELCREFDIEAANFNAPGQIIVSGEKTKVDAAVAAARTAAWKKVIPLNVAGAYHSRLMEPARAAFADFSTPIPFSAPRFTVSPTHRAGDPSPPPSRPRLVKQVVSSVLWEDCMRSAAAAGRHRVLGTRTGRGAGRPRATHRKILVPSKSFAEFADVSA